MPGDRRSTSLTVDRAPRLTKYLHRVKDATARSLSAAEETVAQIRARGGEAEYVQCDVCDEASVEAMVAKTVELFGNVDFAFNNAGVGPDGVTIPFSSLVDLSVDGGLDVA